MIKLQLYPVTLIIVNVLIVFYSQIQKTILKIYIHQIKNNKEIKKNM